MVATIPVKISKFLYNYEDSVKPLLKRLKYERCCDRVNINGGYVLKALYYRYDIDQKKKVWVIHIEDKSKINVSDVIMFCNYWDWFDLEETNVSTIYPNYVVISYNFGGNERPKRFPNVNMTDIEYDKDCLAWSRLSNGSTLFDIMLKESKENHETRTLFH